MDLSTLQWALENAPARLGKIDADRKTLKAERDAIAYFIDAVRTLRTCWRESDPGKYGMYLSCEKDGKKAWPRELVDTAAVLRHVAEHRARHPHWKDYDIIVAPLAELRREACPGCKAQALLVNSVQQTHDSPDGDEWARAQYLLCAACVRLFPFGDPQVTSDRF